MAMSKCSNGEWSDWSIMKIKGEKGDTGENGRDGANGSQLRYLGAWNSTKCYCFQSRVAVSETLSDDVYKYDGKLYADIAKPGGIWSQDGILYIDVVSVVRDKAERYFQATQNSCGIPPLSDAGNVNAGWEEAQHFGMLVTDYMIAKVIDASKVSANEIIIKDGNDKVIGGMTNSTSPTLPDKEEHLVFWTGSDGNDSEGKAGDSSKNARFKVYDDGRVVCSGIDSEINGLATAASEVVLDLADLPVVKVLKTLEKDADGNYVHEVDAYYIDFTQYGTNISLVGTATPAEGGSDPYIAVDLPCYWRRNGSDTYFDDHSTVPATFEKLGFSGVLGDGQRAAYRDAVDRYVNFVNKYKNARVSIRAYGLENISGLMVRGCLTAEYVANGASFPSKIPYDAFVACSTSVVGYKAAGLNGQTYNEYNGTDSLNGYHEFLATDVSGIVSCSFVPTGIDAEGDCGYCYPLVTRVAEGTGYTCFDLSFSARSFEVTGSERVKFQGIGDYLTELGQLPTGTFWMTTGVAIPSLLDIDAMLGGQLPQKPSTYIK